MARLGITNEPTAPLHENDEKSDLENQIVSLTNENSNIGNLLTTAYGVIKLILEHLDWPDLINASKVSVEWQQVANVIFAERQKPTWFQLGAGSSKGRHILRFHRHGNSKPNLCLVILNNTAATRIKCKLMPEGACIDGCKEDHKLLLYIEKMYKKSKCKIVALKSSNVLSCFPGQHTTIIIGSRKREIAAMVGIVIPKITGVRTDAFNIRRANINDNFLRETLGGDDQHIRCLFTFFGLGSRNYSVEEKTIVLGRLMRQIDLHQPGVPFACGGGIVIGSKDKDFGTALYECELLCITFSTRENSQVDFNAYSVILWENAHEEEDVDSIIASLSRKAVRREHMAGFRFACVSRHNVEQVEVNVFRKYFPSVPLVGFEGYGELGLYSVPDDDEDDTLILPESKRPCSDREFGHSNTTIIVLLSWGKVIHSKG